MSRTRNKKRNGGKVIAVLLAVAVLGGGVTACGYASRNDADEWYKNPDFSTWHWTDNAPQGETGDVQNGGNVNTPGENNAAVVGGSEISEIKNNGVTVYKAALPRAAFKAMGVSEQAESAFTLTAEVSPSYASDKSLNWNDLAFLDSESEWATGKEVTDYVTVTPSANGEQAVLACLQDFGEPIVLTVSSVSNPEVCATCYIDYYQRVKSCEFAFFYNGAEVAANKVDGVYKFDYTGAEKNYTAELRPVYSNYTLTDTYTTTINGAFSSAFGFEVVGGLDSLKLPAGLSGGEPELSAAAAAYCNSVTPMCNSYEVANRTFNLVAQKYDNLTSEEKQHPRVICYHNAALTLNPAAYSESAAQAKAIINNYAPPVFTYVGGATFATYNDFVAAVNRCNNSGVGVIEYTLTINGAHSNFTTTLSLGYGALAVNVQDVNLSDNNVAF